MLQSAVVSDRQQPGSTKGRGVSRCDTYKSVYVAVTHRLTILGTSVHSTVVTVRMTARNAPPSAPYPASLVPTYAAHSYLDLRGYCGARGAPHLHCWLINLPSSDRVSEPSFLMINLACARAKAGAGC